ncbi:hypothetical protein CDO87_18910 [Sagittula sp. P11]|uniref:hypothetical protein n=1 Tax=Sagittula sp. P11 TaxID=2009329 RepID=UPI000C2D27AC|nr:hypothetical protein [Sagittula sp. P11]AUC55109.1 hypothetical protein CDO87_18910 [Sagittula sp. P11]
MSNLKHLSPRKARTQRAAATAKAARAPLVAPASLMRAGTILLLIAAMAALAGCGNGQRRQVQTFDGQTFRANAKSAGDDRQYFVASVRDPGKSIDGAIQAAEYQAVKHCIHLYGTSDIDWEVGPDTPKDQLLITSDSLTLSGRCKDL